METELSMYVISHFKEEGKPRLLHRCSFHTFKDSCREKSFSDCIWFSVTISGPWALPLCPSAGWGVNCKRTWSSLLTSRHMEIPWKALVPFPRSFSFTKPPGYSLGKGGKNAFLCLSRVYCLPSCIVTFLPLLPVPIPCPCDKVLRGEPCLSIDILEMVRVVGGPLDLLIKYLYQNIKYILNIWPNFTILWFHSTIKPYLHLKKLYSKC